MLYSAPQIQEIINHKTSFLISLTCFYVWGQSPALCSLCRWCTAAASVDRQRQISTIGLCVWVLLKKIPITPSTSSKMHGGEEAFSKRSSSESDDFLIHPNNLLLLSFRTMHYPPETSSIMLMAKMVAMVKQVRLFIWFIALKIFKCLCLCSVLEI